LTIEFGGTSDVMKFAAPTTDPSPIRTSPMMMVPG
jgi:hypothetical protein